MNLSQTDGINGYDKIGDLRSAIGRRFSDNDSRTHSSVLVGVSECGNICYKREVESEYKSMKKKPREGIFSEPSWLTWNAIFY